MSRSSQTLSRRTMMAGVGAATLTAALRGLGMANPSSFKIAVLTDEISPDLDHACAVAAHDFSLHWVELREFWGKNITDMGDDDLANAEQILAKYQLRVTDIASPLFKVDWPGAPKSRARSKEGNFGSVATFQQQDAVLERSIALAKRFNTNLVRGFDFWRLDDQAPYRAAIDAKLQQAAEVCGKNNLTFILENEYACNTATGREAARTLSAVKSPHFMLNWDPGNAVARGEVDAWPNGWNLLPKDRIGHCHCKDAVYIGTDNFEWKPVGGGIIDWTAQFKALKQIGYSHAVSLETHWKGGGTPEACSRTSFAGMKKDLVAADAWTS